MQLGSFWLASLRRRAGWIAVAVTFVVAPSVTAGASTLVGLNPPANIAPSPNFLVSGPCSGSPGAYTCPNPCVTPQLSYPVLDNTGACSAYVLEAINNARATLGLDPLTLPTNWLALTTEEQLFVIVNLERTSLGYPPYLGLNAALSSEAQIAAANFTDPVAAPGFAVGTDAQGYEGLGGAWASAFSVLASDYLWMYADGWGGSSATTSNIDCTSASDPGCWGHRDELLGSDPGFNPGVGLNCTTCEVGAGYAVVNGQSSLTVLVELPAASPPAMTFTWADETAYLSGASTTTTTSTSTTTTSTTTTTSPPVPARVLVKKATTHELVLAWRTGTAARTLEFDLSRRANCSAPFARRRVALSDSRAAGTVRLGVVSRARYFVQLRSVGLAPSACAPVRPTL